jgi:phosphogluconate dehydratase
LARLRDGDVVRVCAASGALSTTADLSAREPAADPHADSGTGRELFGMMRRFADGAEQGASAMLATGGM